MNINTDNLKLRMSLHLSLSDIDEMTVIKDISTTSILETSAASFPMSRKMLVEACKIMFDSIFWVQIPNEVRSNDERADRSAG